jgi:hypothetical protein
MEMRDPALLTAFFYPAGDRECEHLWQVVQAARPGDGSSIRRQQVTFDGATVVQMIVERQGVEKAEVWQELAQETGRCLAEVWADLPGRPWGVSQFYLAAAVARPQDEQQLLHEGLALPAETAHPMAVLPVGRLWLVSAPAMAGAGRATAVYTCVHSPAGGTRRRIEELLWGQGARLLRADLYLHRGFYSIRQYGREGRASFWAALDQLEATAAGAPDQPVAGPAQESLRRACRNALPGLALLSRRYNVLRSSAYLYRQIWAELCPDEGTLFTWYQERLSEALAQWGYDLGRADRAMAMAQTALLATASPSLPPLVSPPGQEGGTGRQQGGWATTWPFYVIGAAIIALCLVDDSWMIVAARAGAVFLLALIAWAGLRLFRRRDQQQK